jgi:hypothetical protein
MDPITAAILAVLPALASDMVKSTVKDTYEGLKAVIRRKWGDTSPISNAISAIEEDPKSKAQAAGIGGETVAKIQFNMRGGVVQGVAGAENVQIGSINFGTPPKG